MTTRILAAILRRPLPIGLTHGLKGALPLLTPGRVSKLAISPWSQHSVIDGARFKSTKSEEAPKPPPPSAPKQKQKPDPKAKPDSKKKSDSKKESNSEKKSNAKGKEKSDLNQKEEKKRPRQRSQRELRTHLEIFFSQYAKFKYNPAKPYMGEFYRMTNDFGWKSKSAEFKEARKKLNEASVHQFNAIYGHKNDPASWRNFCSVLNIADIPKTLKECKTLVESLYVNICDLLDAPVTKDNVKHFKSEETLSRYTKKEGAYFPKRNAYAGGLLRFLLRHIMVPSQGEPGHPQPVFRR